MAAVLLPWCLNVAPPPCCDVSHFVLLGSERAIHGFSNEVGTGAPWVFFPDLPLCCRVQDDSAVRAPTRACVV